MSMRTKIPMYRLGLVREAMLGPRPQGWTSGDEQELRLSTWIADTAKLPPSKRAGAYKDLLAQTPTTDDMLPRLRTRKVARVGGTRTKAERDLWICLLYNVATRAQLPRGGLTAVSHRLCELFGGRNRPLAESTMKAITGNKTLRSKARSILDQAQCHLGLTHELEKMTAAAKSKYES